MIHKNDIKGLFILIIIMFISYIGLEQCLSTGDIFLGVTYYICVITIGGIFGDVYLNKSTRDVLSSHNKSNKR